MDDAQKTARKARGQNIAVGAGLFAVGTSLQTLAFAAHEFMAQMIIRGSSIFVIIVGIIYMVRAFAKAKDTKNRRGH